MAGPRAEIASHIPRLRRYARALVGDPVAADDLVQDCLERAVSRLHLFRAETNMRAWLFTIMHNVFVNDLRGARRRAALSSHAGADAPSPAASDPAGGLVVRDLARALAQLAPEHRAVVLLVGLEELSYREAAAILDVPVGTVMSRLARGRERLRQLMEGAAPSIRRVK